MTEKFEPTFESLRTYKAPDWFRDTKFGIWSHWGPQSVPMYGDWYARNMYIEGSDQYTFVTTVIRPSSATRISAHYGKPKSSIPMS